MFTEQSIAFIYCMSPVHMGAGTSLGVIDNPIQRERHTEHPVMAGSGIKGAMRHSSRRIWDKALRKIVFGPEGDGAEHAGAVSFSDGQIVAFPVRSLKGAFVYITSPVALGRLERLARNAGLNIGCWALPSVKDEDAAVSNNDLLSGDNLVLESYLFSSVDAGGLKDIAEWIADKALPEGGGSDFFREKLRNDLVLLSDAQFSFFVRNATVVEPHVRINDISGTAEDGGLFITENLPPESLLVSMVMASQERKQKGVREEKGMTAEAIMEKVRSLGGFTQIGGNATTGRGQVLVNFVDKEV